jgi:hypothetical protein
VACFWRREGYGHPTEKYSDLLSPGFRSGLRIELIVEFVLF